MKKQNLFFAAVYLLAFSSSTGLAQSNLDVGSNSSGVVISITSGLNTNANAYIGFTATASNNTLNVLNAGTFLRVQNDLFVGAAGSGNTLLISNGAQFTNNGSRPIFVGGSNGATGNSIVVTDAGSRFSSQVNTAGMRVGDAGFGNSFVASNGATAIVNSMTLGNQSSSSNNSLLVTGAGTIMTNFGTILGNGGSHNSLTVADGGFLHLRNTTDIGVSNGSTGNSILVTGAGSRLSWDVQLVFGVRGSDNSFTVSDGGVVTNASTLVIGQLGGTNNNVLVTGAGSALHLNNGGGITVAEAAGTSATLTVADGGSLRVDGGTIFLGSSSNTTSVLNIGTLGGTDSVAPLAANIIRMGFGVPTPAGSRDINFNQTNTLVITSTISGFGNVNQLAAGTTILTGNNTFTGGVMINAGGVLALGNGGTNGWISGSQGGASGVTTNNGTLQFNRAGQAFYEGSIVGSGSVLKSGTGTVTLFASNAYTGPTTVAAGTLVVDGFVGASAANSDFEVQAGATLRGSGVIGGTLVRSNATIDPAGSVIVPGVAYYSAAVAGNLSLGGDLRWEGGGNYNWRVMGTTNTSGFSAGSTWSLLTVDGTLDLTALTAESRFNINLWSMISATNGAVNTNIPNFDASSNYEWLAVTASNITGFDESFFDVNYAATNGTTGFSNATAPESVFGVRQDGGNLYVTYQAVPEPSTYALLALAAAALGAHAMRRRKRARTS